MTVIAADAVLDALEELHGATLRAGLAYVAGYVSRAIEELEDARHTLDDAIADLGRLADPEPEPEPEP